MTVLKSLLSSFRRTRTSERRNRRLEVASSVSTEALEPRLLLTNPDPFSSLPGAPVTVYLEFSGRTETSAEWQTQIQDGSSSIVTPAFDLDNDPSSFSASERTRIEEIYERVAEDFRPFNINVTTVLPADFVNSEDLLITIGGNGSWRNDPGRYIALEGSFSNVNLPQSAFVFSRNHNGLGGDLEYNIASSVSQSIAVAMGLEVHRQGNGVPIEGDAEVAPILGDSIVGADGVNTNPNSLRDIWQLAPGNDGTTLQDDLAEIVGNPNVEYRVDDYENTLLGATGITIGPGTESVDGVIERSNDVDVFSFTAAPTFGTIRLSTTNLTNSPFFAPTPGSNLDPLLVLKDAQGNTLASADPTGLDAVISTNLTGGTYFIEVSGSQEYGNLGAYTLTLSGIEAIPSFANTLALNSNPAGDVDLYLGFAGGILNGSDSLLNSRVAGQGDYGLIPYDTDGDLGSYSNAELLQMQEIWARVAEDFRPFNVNVTTVRPANFDDGEALQVVIGGDGAILNDADYSAILGAYSDPAEPNTAVVFPGAFEAGNPTDARNIAWRTSAAFARMLGLETHAEFDTGGTLQGPRDPGDTETGPILGQPVSALRDLWVNAPTTNSGTFQDDLATIDAAQNIDFRLDDVGDDRSVATTINIRTGDDVVTGVIERNDDIDVWQFNTLATTATITVEGINLQDLNPQVNNPGSNLDPVLRLLDGAGNTVAFSDIPFVAGDPTALTATVTETLTAGTYYIEVSNRAEYGNLGQYSITIQGVDSNPVTVTVDPDSFSEIDGVQTGVGTVSRPANELFGPEITIWLQSQDETEVIVPQIVTIPASETSVSFDVTIVDDNLLDGDQTVAIQALIPNLSFPDRNDPVHVGMATLNAEDFVTVRDHEEISVSVNPNPVSEDAGTVELTVTRSNTDTGAPNHYVTTENAQLLEFTPDGQQVSTLQVPWHSGPTRPVGEFVHDVEVLEDGRIVVFNGTTSVALSIYNPNTDLWQHIGPFVGLSADSADSTTGGLTSVGNYVFLTDLEAFDDDTHGMMRVDLSLLQDPAYNSANDDFDITVDNGFASIVDGFGAGTLGSRFFTLSGFRPSSVSEINPSTGELIQSIALPLIPGTPFQYDAISITFDGNDLWVLVDRGRSGFDPELIKVDPNTGDLLEEHGLTGLFSNTNGDGPDSVSYLDGRLYLTQSNPFFFEEFLEEYDPVARRLTGNILFPEGANFLNLSTVSTGIQGEGRLAFLGSRQGTATREIFEVRGTDAVFLDNTLVTGVVDTIFNFADNLVHIGDVTFGDITYDDLFFVERTDVTVDVYNRETGQLVDTDPSTPTFIDPLTIPSSSGQWTGGDVPNVSSRELFFRDATVGFDGMLYGLEESGTRISVHDPETLQRIRGIDLAVAVNTIAVGDDAGIYGGGGSGVVTQFDFDGNVVSSLDTALGLLSDIEVNVGGEVLISDAGGLVALTSQAAVAAQDQSGVVTLEDVGINAFISFGRNATKSTGDVRVDLSSSDLTEIQVPDSVVIPRGQQSVTIQIPVIDDAARDGSQDVVVEGTSPEYFSGSVTVTVTDAEQIGVDIAPTEVLETDGQVADAVTIFRTDVEGPLTFVDTNTYASEQSVPIVDKDVTISQIQVPDQVSFLQDVNVKLSLRHDAIPDLDVFLISPNGTRVELFTDLSSNESNMTDTILDDEAGIRIVEASAPFTGRFIPEMALANFDGVNPSGTWTLEVIDDSASDAGVLLDWELELTTIGLPEMTITLSIVNEDEASVPLTVTIPANQSSITLPLDVFDDQIVDGTQTVTISVASSTDDAGFMLEGDEVDVVDVEELSVSVTPTTVQENAGTNAITGTITRVDTNGPLTVNLMSSDTTELAVAPSVTFADGDATVSFSVDVIDDAIFDGDQTATILLQAPGYGDIRTEEITITDEEPRLRLTTINPAVSEADGEVLITISRLDVDDLSQELVVNISSDDLTELTVPATVRIAPGEISTTFAATIVDDDLVDGTQSVTITAGDSNTANPSVNSTSLDLTVADAESVELSVTGSSTIFENAGQAATTVSVSVTSVGHFEPIVVTLSNSDPSELSIPATVTIPVGSSSVSFNVNAVNDGALDGDQLVTISASAALHVSGSTNITVRDHEPPILVGPELTTTNSTPEITWQSLAGATRYDLWLNDVSRGIVQKFRLENLPAANPDGNGLESFVPVQEMGVGIYRYWVRAYDSLERPAAWSTGRTFRVLTAPDITSPSAATGAALTEFPDINWTSIVDTDRYDLWINNVTTGESQVIREEDLQTTNFATSTADLVGGTYKAWVRAIAPDGVTGFWSNSVQFTVLTTPQIIAPTGSTFDRTPEIRWNEIPGASFYDVWVSRQTPGEAASLAMRNQFVEGTSISPTMDFADGRYVAWVRAISADGQATAWSQPQAFEVAGRPVISLPLDNATSTEPPLVSWAGVNQAERYEIWVSNSLNERVYYDDQVTETSVALPESIGFGTFRVWVRAISERGELSSWSLPVTFTVVSADEISPESLLNPDLMLTSFRVLVDPVETTRPREWPVQEDQGRLPEQAGLDQSAEQSEAGLADGEVQDKLVEMAESTVDALMENWDMAVVLDESQQG